MTTTQITSAAAHYLEAERLLSDADRIVSAATVNTLQEAVDAAAAMFTCAQVHATLALAGATLLAHLPGHDTARDHLGDAITGQP